MAKRFANDYLIAALLMAGLVLALFSRQIINGEALLATDLIFQLDPLWRSTAPADFTTPDNELFSDQVYQFYPWNRLTFTNRDAGAFPPLWNPYSFTGAPFLANAQSALFSPYRLLTYPFPLTISFLILALIPLFTAGYGTYLFSRTIGQSHIAALLAMLTFALSGPVLVWLLYPLSLTYTWLPLLLWAGERLLQKQSWHRAVLLSAIIGGQFLGGNPEASFYLLVLWGMYMAFRLLTAVPLRPLPNWWRQQRLPLGKIAVAGGIGFSLAALHLFPFLAYLPQSSIFGERLADSTPWWRTLFFTWQAWPDLITLGFPRFFGTPVNRSYWYPYANYATQTSYIGLLPLLLAGVTLFSLRRQDHPAARFFSLAALFFLGAAIHAPLFAVVNKLPLFNLAMPDRLKIEFAFCAAIAAGFGWDFLRQHWSSADGTIVWRRLQLAGWLLAGGSLFAIVAAYLGLGVMRETILEMGRQQAIAAKAQGNLLFHEPVEFYLQRVDFLYTQMRALFTWQTPVMFLPVLIGGLTALWATQRRRWRIQAWGVVLVAVTAVDLLAVHGGYFPAAPSTIVYPAPALTLPANPAPYRATGLGLAMMPNSNMVLNLPDIRGYDPMIPRRTLDLLRSSPGYTRLSHYALFTQPDIPLFNLLGVRYIVTSEPLDTAWRILEQTADGVTLYENSDALPRVRLLTRAEQAATAAESLQMIRSADFDGRSQLVLEERVSSEVKPVGGEAGTAIIRHETTDTVTIHTESVHAAYLLLTDSYMPGWQAEINGERARVLIANHAFRAVELPPGAHEVTFRYRPRSFQIGIGVSALAAAFLLLTAGRAIWRKP